ncbi:MAG TPA: histone deacetylase, partial [Solirubrobacterales bacterium]|nr:histone deacetylase [Solirubrobacterales bacterium]
MLFFSHPSGLEHDPTLLMPGHPDTPERMVAIEAALAERDWLGWERREAPAASERELELVHSPRLVASIRELSEAGGGRIDADTAVDQATYRAALHAAGGACELTRALLRGEAPTGYACVRPSGHHAERERAMGFCFFDNVAVAAAMAIADLGLQRVAIFDWDVHHGNGTAEIFRQRADVLFFSIHQMPLYPGTGPAEDRGSGPGEGYTVNLPVPPGAGEELWLGLVDEVVIPRTERYEPQLILVSAGYDAHRADPLASCELESSSFAAMATRLRDLAARLGVPLGFVQEGGYHVPSLVESL